MEVEAQPDLALAFDPRANVQSIDRCKLASDLWHNLTDLNVVSSGSLWNTSFLSYLVLGWGKGLGLEAREEISHRPSVEVLHEHEPLKALAAGAPRPKRN